MMTDLHTHALTLDNEEQLRTDRKYRIASC